MKRVKKLLLNTVILTATALIMRTIGMSFSVFLSNRIGPEGIGLFELIMSVYTLAVTFAAAGVRLSTTRLVVDAKSRGTHSSKQIMSLCIRYSLTLGTLAGAALWALSDFIAIAWLDSPEAAICLRILSVGLPFLSLSSCLNGYFTATRRAGRYAFVQVLEQIMRIAISLWALIFWLPEGAQYACVALVVGSCVAEAASTVVSYVVFRFCLDESGRRSDKSGLLKKMLGIAVPDAVGSWVRSSLVTAKNLLIPLSLRKTGVSGPAALATYGTIHGMVLPVITFPAALLNAFSSLLIPEIAESCALGRKNHIRYAGNRVVHLTLLFSIAVAGVLYFFSGPLGEAIYPGRQTSRYIQLIAPVVPIMYLDMMVDGLLKGLGLQLDSMMYNIVDAAMSLSLVLLLIPRWGIWGYIFTIYMSELLNYAMSMGKLKRVAGIQVTLVKSVFAPLLSIATSGMLTLAMLRHGAGLMPSIAACAALYIVLLFLLGSLLPEDARWFVRIFSPEKQRAVDAHE